VRLVAESFYVTGGFWVAAAGVAVALALGVFTLWLTWRASNPKRRLLYGMPVVTPLLNGGANVPHGLEVRRDGQLLTEPHVLVLELFNQGRLDIPNHAFNQDRPLILDVGVRIVDILKTATPVDQAVPAVEIDGTRLEIGPDLIKSRQMISITLLVDGLKPTLSCPPHPLIDIHVDRQDGMPSRPSTARFVFDTVAGVVVAGALLLRASTLTGPEAIAAIVVACVVLVGMPTASWAIARFGRPSRRAVGN
jgi:hypothetical protein